MMQGYPQVPQPPRASPAPPLRPRRSAFAAAFFSFLLPGLGHVYLGRWLRGIAWAILPVLLIAAGAGLALSPNRSEVVAQLSDPGVLVGVLAFIVIDLLYRLVALLDAWRLAQAPAGMSSSTSRLASVAGLLAVLIVLVVSHVAVASPVYQGYSFLTEVTAGGDDSIAGETIDPAFASFLAGTDEPTQDPAIPAVPGAPTAAQVRTPEPTATAPPKAEWDGKKRLDILLVGADGGRYDSNSYLTDTMIVMSIDPPTGRLAFISLPRDTVGVPLPRNWGASRAYGGAYPNKINTLYTVARYQPSLFPGNDRDRGFEALKGALSELYGLDIKYHVAVDLVGFKDVINTLGGVVVDVQAPVQDEGYPADDGRGKLKLYIPPGMQYMSGGEALAYARSRHATSDFDRAGRQQRVITSVRNQIDLGELFEPGKIDKLLRSVRKYIRTDVPPNMLPKLVALAQKVDLDRRISLVLSPPSFASVCYPCPITSPPGQWAIRANVSAMRRAAQNVFKTDPKAEARRQALEGEGATVHVLNGTEAVNVKTTRIAEALAARGIDASVPPVNGGRADADDYRDTLITAYNGAEDAFPETARVLQRTFGAKPEKVDDPSQPADFVIIVGDKSPELKP